MYEIKKGAVVWCELDGKGSEQRGTRPCVVVSVNQINDTSSVVCVVPMTSRTKRLDLPEHIGVDWIARGHKINHSIVLCEHIKTISKERIISYGGYVKYEDVIRINNGIRALLGL